MICRLLLAAGGLVKGRVLRHVLERVYDVGQYYEIKVAEHLDPCWLERFAGMSFSRLEGEGTLISGVVLDQAALHGLLERIRDLNLTLVLVKRGAPSTQDVDPHNKEAT